MKRQRLQVQLGRGIALVALIGQGLVVLVLSLLTSRQIHERTDELLLHLANSEAHAMLEHGSQFHVHDLEFQLPGSLGQLSTRYALVYDESGTILDRSDNLDVLTHIEAELPRALTEARFLDDSLAGVAMRLVVVPAQLEGRQVNIAVGVAHADLEAVLWDFVAIAALIGLLAAFAIALAGTLLVRHRVADLMGLSQACRALLPAPGRAVAAELAALLSISPQAAEEVQLLAETLRDLMARVQRQLAAQNCFVAEAAHELRTPLTSLRGDLELALRRERAAAEYRELIGEALADVDRLQRLALQLLEGARGQHQRFPLAPVELIGLLRELLPTYHQAGAVALDLPAVLWVAAEETAARRVLQILLENWLRHGEGQSLRIALDASVSGVGLVLADDGPGIAPELAERLFQPFQRGSQKGFGLGLYIAAQLMGAMDGAIAHLPSSRGCRFLLQFKAAAAP